MTSAATVRDGITLRAALAHSGLPGIEAATVGGTYHGGLHLAVMTGPFLDLITAGVKTVESRFHRQRRTPLFTAEPGDVVVFRQSGRPATHAAILGAAHYLDLSKTSIGQVRARWADRIGADDDGFWQARADARWVSLLTLYKVWGLPPQQLAKRDRQGWVTYPCVTSTTKPMVGVKAASSPK